MFDTVSNVGPNFLPQSRFHWLTVGTPGRYCLTRMQCSFYLLLSLGLQKHPPLSKKIHTAVFKTQRLVVVLKLACKNSRHFGIPHEMTSKERAQKFHTDDVSLLRSRSGFDWSCLVGNVLQPIRGSTQIWVATRHQYEALH